MSQPFTQYDPKLNQKNSETYFDDFYQYLSASTGPWLTSTTNSGTVAIATTQTTGKVSSVLLTTGGTDGNYVGAYTALSNFIFALNTPLHHATRLVFTSQATNTANVFAGFSSATTPTITNGVISGTASQALIVKMDGEDYWRATSAVSTARTSTLTDLLVVEGVAHTLEVNVNAFDGANLLVTYLVDGNQLKDYTTHAPIMHKVPVSGAVAMYSIFGIQTGATAVQTANVDYSSFSQIRI